MSTIETTTLNPTFAGLTTQIQASDLITALTEKYKHLKIVPDDTLTSTPNDWFQKFDLQRDSEHNVGLPFTIDVQPDMRFTATFIFYDTTVNLNNADINAHPTVSYFSLMSYEIALLSTFLLLIDTSLRKPVSFFAATYLTDQQKADYFKILMNCNISSNLATLLENLPALRDSRRTNLIYIPTFGAATFLHDFGRLIPPQIFLAMHNVLATARSNTPTSEYLRLLYATPIIQLPNDNTFTVSNFTGGFYTLPNEINVTLHSNWINEIIFKIFSPTCARTHLHRPSIAPIPISTQLSDNNDPNIYDLMTMYNEQDYEQLTSFFRSTHACVTSSPHVNTVPIFKIFEKLSGIAPISHTLEPFTLPTWHKLAITNNPLDQHIQPTFASHANFAATTHLLAQPEQFNGNIEYPNPVPADISLEFYEATPLPYDAPTTPVPYHTFNPRTQISPDVFLFQPYERNITIGSISMTLGLKIESEEFDGTTIPLPHHDRSLLWNNSEYEQGSIPIHQIKPTMCSQHANDTVRLFKRTIHENNPIGYSFRTSHHNIIPRFANANVSADITQNYGLIREFNHNDNQDAATFTAWNDPNRITTPQNRRYLWSSYRHVENSNRATRAISLYYSFRPFYGLDTTLTRVRNPNIIIPKR